MGKDPELFPAHRWKLFGGFVARETFFGGLVLTRSQVFSLMFGRDSHAACGKKDVLSSVFGRLLADLDRVKSPGCLHQLPPPEDGLKIIERDGLEDFI